MMIKPTMFCHRIQGEQQDRNILILSISSLMENLHIKTHGEESMNHSLSKEVMFSEYFSFFFLDTFYIHYKIICIEHNEINHHQGIIYVWEVWWSVGQMRKMWLNKLIPFSIFMDRSPMVNIILINVIIWVMTNYWRLWEKMGTLPYVSKLVGLYSCAQTHIWGTVQWDSVVCK